MSTPHEIIAMAASLMNDTARHVYTDEAVLPYLNMSLDELQELFELNNVPSTNEVSTVITCPAGTLLVGFSSLPPTLPDGLVEIRQLWESLSGQNSWVPVDRKDFIPHSAEGIQLNRFGIWAWVNQEIRLPLTIAPIDLKIDYIESIFNTPITIGQINIDLPIKNSKSYLGYRTAGLCAQFIGENSTRAEELNNDAGLALDRTLGISTKGRQSIVTRRRPFRSSYKSRSY